MKTLLMLAGTALLLGTAGCEVESGYGYGGAVYGEYPAYGGPVYVQPYYYDGYYHHGDWRHEHWRHEHRYWE